MIYDLQKANMWKRISAYMFDFILLCVLVVGMALLLSGILGYDNYIGRLEESYDLYEEKYGISLDISAEEYEKLSDEKKATYEAASDEFAKDVNVITTYNMIANLTLIIATFSILISYLLLEFLVPMLFKNGQTLGKKVFGIAIMRVDGVKVTPFMLFVRTVLGKFTIETLLPVLLIIMILFNVMDFVGLVVIVTLAILQIAVIIATKTNSAIHDLLSATVAVDMASQLIFDSPEELIAYKKRVHAEQAEKSPY